MSRTSDKKLRKLIREEVHNQMVKEVNAFMQIMMKVIEKDEK